MQLARLDYNNERRRWEADRLREAPPAALSDDPEAEFADQTHWTNLGTPSSSRMTDPDTRRGESTIFSNSEARSKGPWSGVWEGGQAGAETAQEEAEAEAIAQLEDEELEALLSLMEAQQHEQERCTMTTDQQTDLPAQSHAWHNPLPAGNTIPFADTQQHTHDPSSVHFGSDDEEYDTIFTDLMDDGHDNGYNTSTTTTGSAARDMDTDMDMDMSMG